MLDISERFKDRGRVIYSSIRTTTLYRWTEPLFDPVKLLRAVPHYIGFFRDLIKYSKLPGAESIRTQDTYPCIHDKTQTTGFDTHYFYQDIWALKKIYEAKPDYHVDVASHVEFVGFLTAITKVIFIDIRPLLATLENFDSINGSILSIPFKDDNIISLSCLHVVEHIGLGRYGDPLDPLGTKKACEELSRILAVGGNLYFSLPIGKPRLCFNAHRIHSPQQIIEYFSDLELVEFSGIDDEGKFKRNIDISILENSNYACGLFHFTKK
jgi:SAM-dependent methyltransferase